LNGKPKVASGYQPGAVERVRRTLLLIAAKLGDLLEEVVVVGGLVPYLLVEQSHLNQERRHVGTLDLDLGLSIAILNNERYREISARLRDAGFGPDTNENGNLTRQRWMIASEFGKLTVDFLIPPNKQGDPPGLTNIEPDLAALTTLGLDLAFIDRQRVRVEGEVLGGGTLHRDVWVCGPAAFVVLKSIAFRNRGENKDAYDLFYVLREAGTEAVAGRFVVIPPDHPAVVLAKEILRVDFVVNSRGRLQIAQFITGAADDALQADALAQVNDLLRRLKVSP
jgi:predicted nucleotidyltransferase